MGFVAFHLKDKTKKRGSDGLENKLYECSTVFTSSSAGGQQTQRHNSPRWERILSFIPSPLLLDQLWRATRAPFQKFTAEELVCTRQWTPFFSLSLSFKSAEHQQNPVAAPMPSHFLSSWKSSSKSRLKNGKASPSLTFIKWHLWCREYVDSKIISMSWGNRGRCTNSWGKSELEV